jgi:H+/Cl- antiporter ClcA
MSNQPPAAYPQWQPWPEAGPGQWSAAGPLPAAGERIAWLSELVVGGLIAGFSGLLGAVVGLIWPRVAPHIQLVRAINGSEAASKALLGDDLWLALLGVAAGIFVVAVLTISARDAAGGPGAVLGLAIGGFLGSLVAAHVGHLVQQPHLVTTLRASYKGITPHSIKALLGYFDFKVRAKAVLLAWPIAAIAMHGVVVVVRFFRHDSGR